VIGGEERRVTVFLWLGGEQGQPCEVTVTLGTGFSANDVDALGDAGVRLQWQIDVRLPYLSRGAVPAGATLEILDEPDR